MKRLIYSVREIFSERKKETFYIMNYLNESKGANQKGFYIPKDKDDKDKDRNAMFITKEEYELVKEKELPFFIEVPEVKQEFKVI
ncbi:hypothetical protein ACEI28_003883 [Vibrio alginolyticus]|nr:hypothetical protein [Vibrio parahaemolyticus]ELI5381574.1 hypothetical protein [Vibrio parahaemolyticus]